MDWQMTLTIKLMEYVIPRLQVCCCICSLCCWHDVLGWYGFQCQNPFFSCQVFWGMTILMITIEEKGLLHVSFNLSIFLSLLLCCASALFQDAWIMFLLYIYSPSFVTGWVLKRWWIISEKYYLTSLLFVHIWRHCKVCGLTCNL